MRSNRELSDSLALKWLREANDRERMGSRDEYTPHERRVLTAQANVYRACAKELRDEGRKLNRG